MKLTRIAIVLVANVMILTLNMAARAQVLFSDDFEYTAFTTPNNVTTATTPVSKWFAHSGAGTNPQQIGTGPTAGNLILVEPAGEDIHAVVGSTLAAGSTWFYAIKFSVKDTRTVPGTGPIFPFYFAHMMEDLAGAPANQEQMFRSRIYVQGTADASKFTLGYSSGTVGTFPTEDPDFDARIEPSYNNYSLDVDGNDYLIWQRNVGRTDLTVNNFGANGDATSDLVVDAADLAIWQAQFGTGPKTNGQRIRWAGDLTFDTEYIAVASYTSDDGVAGGNDGHARLWVNPVNEASTSILDSLPNTNIVNDAARPQAWMAFRQVGSGSTDGNGPAQISIDAVALDDSFADVLASVTGAAAGNVPEPGSLSLVAYGGLAILAARRRRLA